MHLSECNFVLKDLSVPPYCLRLKSRRPPISRYQ